MAAGSIAIGAEGARALQILPPPKKPKKNNKTMYYYFHVSYLVIKCWLITLCPQFFQGMLQPWEGLWILTLTLALTLTLTLALTLTLNPNPNPKP